MPPSEGNEDVPQQGRKVPFRQLVEVLGDQARWLSEDMILLPEIKGHQWGALLKNAEPHFVDNIFDWGFDPDNDPHAPPPRQEPELSQELTD